MNICVYCSSSTSLDPVYFRAGRAFGESLAKRGHTLVYGGYNQGVMGAVAEGAKAAGGEIIAVVPAIFDRPGFTYPGCTRVIKTADMSERKATMERIGDGFAVLPGGIGTFDEFFEAYVLRTLGQLDKPMGILNVNGCYDLLAAFLDRNMQEGFLSAANREGIRFFTDGEALLNALEEQ